jgi:hypothetical protein
MEKTLLVVHLENELNQSINIDHQGWRINDSCWRIRPLTAHSLDLALCFNVCLFNRVRRDNNQMAHALAKVALKSYFPFCCNLNSAPPSVYEAWARDLFLLSS